MSSDSESNPAAPNGGEPALPSRPVYAVTAAQKRHLRGLAHKIRPIVFVGEGGISASVAGALDDALTAHELVKVRLRQPNDKKAAAQSLSEATGAALCAVVGHTVVLYRPHPEEPKIVLPSRD